MDSSPPGSQFSLYLSSLPADAVPYLDKQLDWDQGGVDRHLNAIADTMIDWEEKLSALMCLTPVEISDLKGENSKLILRR